MVRLLGIAPRSADYQSAALLLSYGRIKWRRAEVLRPNRSGRSICFRDSVRASADSLSIGPRGRTCTCVVPLRRRRPELLGHAETERGERDDGAAPSKARGEPRGGPSSGSAADKLDLAAGLSPASPRSKRGMMYISLREENWSLHEDLHLDFELRTLAS